jgi:hypothetical protein
MSKLVNTRVLEIFLGEWVVQFEGTRNWTTFSDTFFTEADAQAWEQDQIDLVDLGDEG